jgi:hypothetical protein
MFDSGTWWMYNATFNVTGGANFNINLYINYHSKLILNTTSFGGSGVNYHMAVDDYSHIYMAQSGVHSNANYLMSAYRYSLIESHDFFFSSQTFATYVLEAVDHSQINWSDGKGGAMGDAIGPGLHLRNGSSLTSEPLLFTTTRADIPGTSLGSKDPSSFIEHDPMYNVAAPSTGGTVTMAAGLSRQVLNPAGTIATLTVNLPTLPFDGDVTEISTSQTVTALTVATTDSSSIIGAPSTLVASTGVRFVYRLSNTTWYIA